MNCLTKKAPLKPKACHLKTSDHVTSYMSYYRESKPLPLPKRKLGESLLVNLSSHFSFTGKHVVNTSPAYSPPISNTMT